MRFSSAASRNACFRVGELLFVAADGGLQEFGFVGVVGCFDLGERYLFRGVVSGADLAGSLEGQMFKHVGQAALAFMGSSHIAGIDKGVVAEDGRFRPLTG